MEETSDLLNKTVDNTKILTPENLDSENTIKTPVEQLIKFFYERKQ